MSDMSTQRPDPTTLNTQPVCGAPVCRLIITPCRSVEGARETVNRYSMDGGVTYDDIESCTRVELCDLLAGVESVVLSCPHTAIYLTYHPWTVELDNMDNEFLDRVSSVSKAVSDLICQFRELPLADDQLLRCDYKRSHVVEKILVKLEKYADKYIITAKQIDLLKSIYMIMTSDKLYIDYYSTNDHPTMILGCRKQLRAVSDIVDICITDGIRIGVLDGDGVIEIHSFDDLEACASTFVMDGFIDVYPANYIIGRDYFTSDTDTKKIHTHINGLLRSGCHDDTKFVFGKTAEAFSAIKWSGGTKHPLCPDNVSYYGAAYSKHQYTTVVLVGVPVHDARLAFITDQSQELSIRRYKRYRMLDAIGRARVVYCIGVSMFYLERALGGIKGIRYHGAHKNGTL